MRNGVVEGKHSEVIIAGAGPAGLSAGEVLSGQGRSVTILEQNHDIGLPVRTSGGTFIDEMEALRIPARLYHPLTRVRFLSPNNSASFDYPVARFCILDVRGTFQYLAERAIGAGARIRLATRAVAPIVEDGFVRGVRTNDRAEEQELRSRLVVDATG